MRPSTLTPKVEQLLDELLQGMPIFSDAKELALHPILPTDFVLAQKYKNSFPQHALEGKGIIDGKVKFLLSPTCCYPIFHLLEGTSFHTDVLYTNKSNCFRNESECIEGVRQMTFRMREYVFFSSDLTAVHTWIASIKNDIPPALETLGIRVEIVKATDPFFNPRDFQQILQSSEDLKSEFIHYGVSLASVNLHLKAFSRSCSLVDKHGKHIYTACFGLGYDRVAAVLRRAEVE